MENELNQICNKVSSPTIKQAFSRHLTDVVTAQNHHRLHLHNKDEKTMSSKQSKHSEFIYSSIVRPPELISVKEDIPSYIEDHSKCCFKIHEMDQMLADLMKSPPKEEEEYTEEYHPEEEFELDLDLVECYDIEFKQEKVKIQAWENHEKRKAEMEMKRMEAKAERLKSRAQEKYTNKLASTRRIAEEKRAKAEATMNEKAVKTCERADYTRRTGHLPSSFSVKLPSCSCCW
ncbi:remorin [Artemisia annua]|uniref:Remorin n=1 Tax=Artemisia annua TaxID=35608 RepID=A0A2U1NH50_ARTAN|nr:remorin [Artemisia annua]